MNRTLTWATIFIATALPFLACGVGRPIHQPPKPVLSEPEDRSDPIEVVWIGHATLLIRIEDKWILTDPVFEDRVGHAYKRYIAPAMSRDDLPDLDALVVSHAHLDHLEEGSLRRLRYQHTVATSGLRSYLQVAGQRSKLHTLRPWESTTMDGLKVTVVPARHGDGRYYVDALWNEETHAGFVFEYKGHTVYFAGDTGYDEELFREIGSRHDIDLALLPVGPADRWEWVHRIRRSVHLDPAYALRAFSDLQADWMIPIHYSTFFKDARDDARAVERAIAKYDRQDRVCMIGIGESLRLGAPDCNEKYWRPE